VHATQVPQGIHAHQVAERQPVGQGPGGVGDGGRELVPHHGRVGDVALLAPLVDADVGTADERTLHAEKDVAGLEPGNLVVLDLEVEGGMQDGLLHEWCNSCRAGRAGREVRTGGRR
jgi:hypothetical protein